MLRTFDCPKCGAPVNYVRNDMPGAPQTPLRCDYCHSSLIAPDESQGQPARVVPITIDLRNLSSRKVTKWIWVILAIPLLGVLIGLLAMVGALAPVFYSISRTEKPVANPPVPTRPRETKEPGNPFADVVLKFGSEGIGPGMFTDARSIAVDGAGRIYVGEYNGGRIQVFDPAGKFITQWSIGDRKTLLRGLGADRKGIVYVVTGGDIRRYEGETGKLLGQLEYVERSGFDDVAVAADGGLVAAWYINRDDIVRFDSNGKLVRTIREAISSASGDSELNTRVAIDGSGNIYALGTFNSAIFKFTPEGKFVTRFSGPGDQPGQLRAPSAVAVDGKGRIYVCDIKGIQVFDTDGRYLRVLKPGISSFAMTFNDQNELFVVARKEVIKLVLKGD
jgi:outer membrane protein assembly factor BamB